jgi:hypothetical protein
MSIGSLDAGTVIGTVAEYYGFDSDQIRLRRSRELSRDVAAWLCRRLVSGTLRELVPTFGVAHPDSVSNLVRRVDRAKSTSRPVRGYVETLRGQLMKTANRTRPRGAPEVRVLETSVARLPFESREYNLRPPDLGTGAG